MTNAAAQQKSAQKKKRTCKHVLKAKEERDEVPAPKKGTPKNSTKNRVKNPRNAALYLTLWKNHPVAWKFNKNTQSWLLRHMYEAEKVSKDSFFLLLEYMNGLQGLTRTRAVADAKRRALRYKEYETARETNAAEQTSEAASGDPDYPDKQNDNRVEDDVANEDDETCWKRLNDHDKRKEYKRARKVLETLEE